jgi:hypothetical protein
MTLRISTSEPAILLPYNEFTTTSVEHVAFCLNVEIRITRNLLIRPMND